MPTLTIRALIYGGLSAYSLLLLCHHIELIRAPVPLDLYEGTMLLVTGIIAAGDNPYTLAYQPHAADVYPPLYNLIVAPLSLVWGNSFALHRWVAAVFIGFACALVGYATYRRSRSRELAIAAGVLLYPALLFYATPVSSTNALGTALFLATVILPWRFQFSTVSLVVAALMSLLALYAKQYFVLGMPILCLYVFLYRSMLAGVLLGAFYAVLALVSLALVHWYSPYYLDNTMFAPAAAIQGLQSSEILYLQLQRFALVYAGLLICLLLLVARAVKAMPCGVLLRAPEDGWRLQGPALRQEVDYFGFALFWSTAVIVAWLGRNPGNYMTYLFQLMAPFVLIVVCSALAHRPFKRWMAALCLVPSFYLSWDMLHRDFDVDMTAWAEVERKISNSEQVLATQMLVASLLKYDVPVFQDGHTFYFPAARSKPELFVKTDPEHRVDAVWESYIETLYRKIERGEFDYVMVSPWEMRGIFGRNPPPFSELSGREFLRKYYVREDDITLSMTNRHGAGTWKVQVWKPRNTGA
jgi:hypothetical protein